jgi:phosphoserine phosphatase
MPTPNWQLKTPVSAIAFDCDGTLSALEGIDALAEQNGTSDNVKSLTEEAMGKSGLNAAIYQKRLSLVNPTQQQVTALGEQYFAQQVPDAHNVIRILKQLNKSIYLISAGLYPAVLHFGKSLDIPPPHIFAVDIQFDSNGHYLDFDHTSPLIKNEGKRTIINLIKKTHPHIIYVGDGLNDYAVFNLVERFIGYGGTTYRENIARLCPYYINLTSMAPLLPLALTADEHKQLPPEASALYRQGLLAIEAGKVLIQPSFFV